MYSQEVIVMKCRELLEEYRALLDRDTVLRMEQNMSPAGYEEIDTIHLRQLQLERTAKNLDSNLYRTFLFLKQCATMDALPIEKRHKANSFAKAMTALEGLPVQQETEQNMLLWEKGEKLFSDFYMVALQDYHVLDGM